MSRAKRENRLSSLANPRKLDGSFTHSSLHTEPSFMKLRASHADTQEGLAHDYKKGIRPSRTKKIMTGKGTKADKYWPVPKEYGPNYQRNLAKGHFAEGGQPQNNWIQGAIKHPGSLHKALRIPEGQKIPVKTLEKAAHSPNHLMEKRANLALTLRGFHHKR